MKPLSEIVRQLIQLRKSDTAKITLLAVCPNSEAVLSAAIKAAKDANAPLLLAATLNQVDRDGGYTGWTPLQFTQKVDILCKQHNWNGPVYPCLDHGGPWLKDIHTIQNLSLQETMAEVKQTLTACLEAGYQLLHIDPTVDRTLGSNQVLPIAIIIERTVELIQHAESERIRLNLPPISYEVGSEEVHGGLVDLGIFKGYIEGLQQALTRNNLAGVWPAFIVAQVGTNLHTTDFDPFAAKELFDLVSPRNSLIKGHYTDNVSRPDLYPQTGMGAANVGPEFTSVEFDALIELENKEKELFAKNTSMELSHLSDRITLAVVASNRWRKWLQNDEQGKSFADLSPERKTWLLQTGSRYIWTDPKVVFSRKHHYQNLANFGFDANELVVDKIAERVKRYFQAFNLVNSIDLLY